MTRPTLARAAVSLGLVYGFGGSWSRWHDYGDVKHAVGLGRWLDLSPLTQTGPALALFAVLSLAALAFLLRVREVAAGIVAVGVLGLVSNVELAVVGGDMPGLAQMLVGAIVSGWTLGLVVARRKGLEAPEVVAHEVACGVVASTFFLSGLAKLVGTGVTWMNGRALAMMVYEHGILGPDALEGMRTTFASTPGVPVAAAAGVVIFELSGFLYCVPRLRRGWSALSCLMFLGFFLLMDLEQLSWALIPVAMAWSPIGRVREGRVGEAPAVLG